MEEMSVQFAAMLKVSPLLGLHGQLFRHSLLSTINKGFRES
jgi:hypothetical protein